MIRKRSLRRLRTWAPPISIGVIVGAGLFLLSDRLDRDQQVQPVSAPTASIVHYQTCDAARAAGAAPLRRGQPGYRRQLDADHDGVACEPVPVATGR